MHLHLENMASYVDANRRREAERRRVPAPASSACSPRANEIGRWRGAGLASRTLVRGQRTMGRLETHAARQVPNSFTASDRPPDQARPATTGRAPVV
jgi:hypothetical protein